jgi:hypothetical protein
MPFESKVSAYENLENIVDGNDLVEIGLPRVSSNSRE